MRNWSSDVCSSDLAARASTGEQDALITARGTIEGRKAVVGVQDFAFMGGSMGLAVGEAFVAGVEAAIADKCPYIIFTASGGARMQEGILSLMQKIGRASCRESVCQYVLISVGAGALKKKNERR